MVRERVGKFLICVFRVFLSLSFVVGSKSECVGVIVWGSLVFFGLVYLDDLGVFFWCFVFFKCF